MENVYPQYVTREAIVSLIKKLNLPSNGEYSQDWEYEVADSSRVAEFIHFYENVALNIEEKFALMTVIVSSYNDAIEEGKTDNIISDKIKYHLSHDINIHKHTILNWALLDEESIEDCYPITPLMREVQNKN
jgi:hypothetical protein